MSLMRRKDSKMDWILLWDTSNLAWCWVFSLQAVPIPPLPEAISVPRPWPESRRWPRVPLETSSVLLLWHRAWALFAGLVWVSLQQEEPVLHSYVVNFQLKRFGSETELAVELS